MNLKNWARAVLPTLALTSCGGGGGGTAPGSGAAYQFVQPTPNSTLTYSDTIVDNANNTINAGFTETVLAVDPDGGFVILNQPANPTLIVNGTNYGGPPQTQTFNGSGQGTTVVYTDGVPFTCAYTPHGFGPDYPVRVGQTWTLDYTYGCNSAEPTAFSQTGTVVDVESVTVPAGTYSAIKLQSTLTWTDANGTVITQTVSNWRDVASSISVKQDISIAYGGTPPTNGHAVSRTIMLLSTS